MHTKLTLRLDEQLIENAKVFAQQSGKSLSQIVADYFVQLGKSESNTQPLPPITASLKGSLHTINHQDNDKHDYHRYLEDKYL